MMMAEPDGLTLAWRGHEPFADAYVGLRPGRMTVTGPYA